MAWKRLADRNCCGGVLSLVAFYDYCVVPVSWDLLVKDVSHECRNDLDYIVDMIDWEVNLDPEFKKNHYVEPIYAEGAAENSVEGYAEKWVVYGSEDFSSKELTVFPKRSITIEDKVAYGITVVQGHGSIGKYNVEAPTMIRYEELLDDELFVTVGASKDGVKITNEKSRENLVILKHFGPENPDAPTRRSSKRS